MKRLLLVCLMMTCSVSYAEWIFYTESGSAKHFYENTSFRRENATVRMWTMSSFFNIQNINDKLFQTRKQLRVYDCKKEKSKLLTTITYKKEMGMGEVVYSFNYENEEEWDYSVPGSIMELEFQIACLRK